MNNKVTAFGYGLNGCYHGNFIPQEEDWRFNIPQTKGKNDNTKIADFN